MKLQEKKRNDSETIPETDKTSNWVVSGENIKNKGERGKNKSKKKNKRERKKKKRCCFASLCKNKKNVNALETGEIGNRKKR